MLHTIIFTLLCCAALLPAAALAADSTEVQLAEALSSEATLAYLGLGVGLPLLAGEDCGEQQALRNGDAVVVGVIASELLKQAIQQERPDGSSSYSMPSTHATATFAMARMQAEHNPDDAAWWYAGATAIAWSRVRLNKHRPEEVLAGAALGYGIAELELSLPNGILLQPWIEEDCMGCQICWEP